jgi:20S proteasome alpha/beta subunit
MTCCIAAICDGGRSAVLVADRMLSGVAGLQVAMYKRKIVQLSRRAVVAFTGGTGEAESARDKVSADTDALSAGSVMQIAEKLRDICAAMRRDQVERMVVRRQFDMGYSEYGKIALSTPTNDIVRDMYTKINGYKLSLELLLAGIDESGARLYSVTDELIVGIQDLAFRAIGSGCLQASASIARRGHNPDSSIAQTVYTLYEAKRAAEMVEGVGLATDVAILRRGHKPKFSKRKDVKCLKGIYKRLRPPRLSADDVTLIESRFSLS